MTPAFPVHRALLRLAAGMLLLFLFPLARAAELRGRVSDAITGKSLHGAVVTLTPVPAAPVLTATADLFGRYTFTGVAAGSFTLGATHPGYVAFSEARSFTAAELAVRDIPLTPLVPGEERIDVFVQVFDTSTMRQLSGVPVRVQRFGAETGGSAIESVILTTNSDGWAVLRSRPKSWFTFRFNSLADGTAKDQYSEMDRTTRVYLDKHHTAVAQLLPVKRNVKITVTGPDPARPEDGMVPLKDVYVEVLGVSFDPPSPAPPGFDPVADDIRPYVKHLFPPIESRTDENGEVIMKGLPPLIYLVTTKKPGYRTPQIAIVPDANELLPATFPVMLLPDLRTKVDVMLTSPYPSPRLAPVASIRLEGIAGTATAGIERMKDGGVTVPPSGVWPLGAMMFTFTGTDHLVPGRYRVSVTDKKVGTSASHPALDGAFTTTVEIRFRGDTTFDLGVGEVTTVELPVTPVPATIRGKLWKALDRAVIPVAPGGAPAPLDRWEGPVYQPGPQPGIQFVESVLADLLPPGIDLVSADAGLEGTFTLSVLPGIYGVKIPGSPDWGSNYRAVWTNVLAPLPHPPPPAPPPLLTIALGWPYATAAPTIPIHPWGSAGIPLNSGDDVDLELYTRRQLYYLNGTVIVDTDSQAQDRVLARDGAASFHTPFSHLKETLEAVWDENAGLPPAAMPVELAQSESVNIDGTKSPGSGAHFLLPVMPGTHSITLRHKAGFARPQYTLPLGAGGPFTIPSYGTVGSGAALVSDLVPLEHAWEHLAALPDAFRPDYTDAHTLEMKFYGKDTMGAPVLRFTRTNPHYAWHPEIPGLLIPIGQITPIKMMKGTWRVCREEAGDWYQADVVLDAGDPAVKVIEFNLAAEFPFGGGPFGDPPSPEYDLQLAAINEDDPTQHIENLRVNFGDEPGSGTALHLYTSATGGTSLQTSWKGGFTPLAVLSSGTGSTAITQWRMAFGPILEPTAYRTSFTLGARPVVTVTMRLERGSKVDGVLKATLPLGTPGALTLPLAGARVQFRNRFGRLLQTVPTDATGLFVTAPALTTQEVIFVELDAPGYLPRRIRVSPSSTGELVAGDMNFHLGDVLLERLPEPEFAGAEPVFNRKGMFLVGVRKGTVEGGTAFGDDPDVKMTYHAEAVAPPPASTAFQGYDFPDGALNYSPTPIALPDQIIAYWIVGQRTWTDNPTETSGTIIRPPYDVFPAVYPPEHADAGEPHEHAGKVNPLFPVEMKAWLAELHKSLAPGVRKEVFAVRHGAPILQAGGSFLSTGIIDLAALPPGLFQPYVIAETRLGAYKVMQVAYSGAQSRFNLFGMELPSYLNRVFDIMGSVSNFQTLGKTKLEASYSVAGFVSFTPKIEGDIIVTAGGDAKGTLDYGYTLGANIGVGERMSSHGLLTFMPTFIGVEGEAEVELKVLGSDPTSEEPGQPSVTLSGKALGGPSVSLAELMKPPVVSKLKIPVEITPRLVFGGGLTSTEIGQLPSAGNEYFRPLQRRLQKTFEAGIDVEAKGKILTTVLAAGPGYGPPLAAVFSLLGTDINAEVGAGLGVRYSREQSTRYRVPGELLAGLVPPPASSDPSRPPPFYPIGRTEPASGVLTRLVGVLGDEALTEINNTSYGLYAGVKAGIGAELFGQEAKITIGTAGPDESIIGLPSLLISLNTNGDGPNTLRVQGSFKCTGEAVFTNYFFSSYKLEHDFFTIPIDYSFNTVPAFYLVPFDVTETSTSLASAPSVFWCGAEPHLAAGYSPLSPHSAATSGSGQTMAYIDPDSAGGVMSIRVARQLAQGTWSLPETVASAPGIVSVALNGSPTPGGFVVAWAEVTAAGLTALVPVTTIKYSLSTDGIVWSPATTLGTTTGGTATNLKWLNMAGSTMGLVWQKSERGPGASTLDIQGAWFSGGAFGPILTLYDEADIASWDAVGPGFPEPTTAKIVRLSNAGSLTVAEWSGTVLGAPTTLGTGSTAVNCRVAAAPGGVFLVAAADTAGALKFYKKTGPGAWGTLTTPAGLSAAAPRELALCTTTSPPGPRFFLTWTEGADHRHPVFAWMDAFGLLLHGPTHIATDTPGSYSKLVAIPVGGAHAADIHAFFQNGDTGELRAFATTISGLPASDRDGDTLNDLAELRLVDASSTDALEKIDDITAAADFDGDGYSNGAEFTAGTDAADANNFPAQRLQIEISVPDAYELSNDAGAVTITRTGNTAVAVTARYSVSGTAANGTDCVLLSGEEIIPAGASGAIISIEPLSDALAEGSETLTLTLTLNAAYTIGTLNAASVTIHDPPFDAWRFSKFTAAELANDSIGGVLGDAESDSSTNLLEYAFDSDPKNGALDDMPFSGIVTHPGTNEKHLALAFLRRKNDLELVYVVQLGSNLAAWTDAAETDIEEISVVDNGDGTETVTVREKTPLTTQARRFLRIDVRRVE